jgi:hypothetical protein
MNDIVVNVMWTVVPILIAVLAYRGYREPLPAQEFEGDIDS